MKYLLMLSLMTLNAFAMEEKPMIPEMVSSFSDFVAPSVSSTSSVADKQIGMIVYDASSDQFKGLDSAGNWNPMTSPTGSSNVASSSSGTEFMERVHVTCVGSSCSVSSASGSWIQTFTRSSLGQFSIVIASGVFTATPTCVCTPDSSSSEFCNIRPTSATAVAYTTSSTSSLSDDSVNILCMGPH